MPTPEQILKKYWGHDSFRPVQKDIIEAVLAGKDTLALLPTGGGKSVCFQVPAMLMDGMCLVVSPLVALMKDQVENLKKKGIPALCIHSGLPYPELRKALQYAANGNCKFLYVSPERIETSLFLEFLPAMKPCLIAIDEAHCISQWGYDFRPSYLKICRLREHLPAVPVIALTASATPQVQADICERLDFDSPRIFRQPFERPNLAYRILQPEAKQHAMLDLIGKSSGTGIVYCRNRKRTAELARLLTMHGIPADHYHAGLSNEERNKKQEDWIQDRIRIMVCTNAFGMGIDKPDVRLVIHYDLPDCIENYYQEAGRAGRDGKPAEAILLYSEQDIINLEEQAAIRYPTVDRLRTIYTALMNHLQVPAGAGGGMHMDFDPVKFAVLFKLDVTEVIYALQFLSRESLFEMSESVYKPSRVVFSTDKEQMLEYENAFPAQSELIKCLLRNYEGIFDQPTFIREQQIAYLLGSDAAGVEKELKILHANGIIRYEPRSDTPQITLLCDRMYKDDFKIDALRLKMLREQYLTRVSEMKRFVTDRNGCRSRFIANYFGEVQEKDCGICDHCRERLRKNTSEKDSENTISRILQSLETTSLTGKQLLETVKPADVEKFHGILNFLIGEERIEVDETGMIGLVRAKKKGPR